LEKTRIARIKRTYGKEKKTMKRLMIMNEGLQAWINHRTEAQSPYSYYSLSHIYWVRGWLCGYMKECS